MSDKSDFVAVDGTAALSICEALLLALIDRGVVTASTVEDLLSDVIATHSNAAAISPSPEKHQAIVQIVQNMLRGKAKTTLE